MPAAENHSKRQPEKNAKTAGSIAADVGTSAVAAVAMLGLVFGGCCSNVGGKTP